MMKKIFHLSTCSTCKRILKEVKAGKDIELQDIKEHAITRKELQGMKKLAGSYEALFSRRSMKYRERGLVGKELSEKDYERLILEEYTFLLRPVAIIRNKIFIGSAKKVTEALKEAVGKP